MNSSNERDLEQTYENKLRTNVSLKHILKIFEALVVSRHVRISVSRKQDFRRKRRTAGGRAK